MTCSEKHDPSEEIFFANIFTNSLDGSCATTPHLLVLVNEQKVFFEVLERKNRATLTEVLGTDLQETLVADRGFPYKASKTQSCLAHLKRNVVGLAEKIKVDPPLAAKIIMITKRLVLNKIALQIMPWRSVNKKRAAYAHKKTPSPRYFNPATNYHK